jgi:hypothetical protein
MGRAVKVKLRWAAISLFYGILPQYEVKLGFCRIFIWQDKQCSYNQAKQTNKVPADE